MQTIEINYETVKRYARKIEKQNLSKGFSSLCWVSMLNHIKLEYSCFDSNNVGLKADWKKQFDQFIK